jgi:hypothetical protein
LVSGYWWWGAEFVLHRALAANIVAGRTESKYHPLPWVGDALSDVTCPTALQATTGATLTCTGTKSDGATVKIRRPGDQGQHQERHLEIRALRRAHTNP